jgi:lanosterol synthase
MMQNNSNKALWQLLSKNGRQIWAYKPTSNDIDAHLDNAHNFSEQELNSLVKDFQFNRVTNPSASDKIFRSQMQSTKVRPSIRKKAKSHHKEEQRLIDGILNGMEYFAQLQSDEGHWAGDYGGPLFLLPGLLIASYLSDAPFPKPHQAMMQIYLFNHQHTDGGWGMHIEGQPTMFGTVMQYVSLRILGVDQSDTRLIKARQWIKNNGGAVGIPSWGKFYLALLNLYDWKGFNSLLPEIWLLPAWLPFHPSRYWCHSRMVYLPMAYCYAKRIQAPENELILSLRKEIYCTDFASIHWEEQRNTVCKKDIYTIPSPILKWTHFINNGYEKIKLEWLRKKTTAYLLKYINAEDAQTHYLNIGPVSQAINSVCIWHAYGQESAAFKKHQTRWYDYLWVAEDGMKMSGYNGSQLWDTAFTMRAMLESDLGLLLPNSIEKGGDFIDNMQILAEHETHQEFFRHPMIGSWPFSTAEQGWSVADCTSEGLSAILAIQKTGLCKKNISDNRLTQAVDIILSYQNKDGGWPTYELQRAPKYLEKLNPSEIFADIMVDYSWTECSAACCIALLDFQERFPNYKTKSINSALSHGLTYIVNKQKDDGSWYGGWAVCFTYATWFSIEALRQGKAHIDQSSQEQCINKATDFLLKKQMTDGGWGETYESCAKMTYTQAKTSQVVNTAWALLGLQAAQSNNQKAIQQGINLLLKRQQDNGDWVQENISGVFNYNCMITYSSYRNIFPIWALNRCYKLSNFAK